MLSVDNSLDPLLKRPFSIHRRVNGDLQFLYRVVGRGTAILSRKKNGDILEVFGPLGNKFPVRKSQKNIILVAGGLGIAPIFGLAESLTPPAPSLLKWGESRSSGKRKSNQPKLWFFYGLKTGAEALCTDELKSIEIDPVISTDDGTMGKKGNIVNVLKHFIARNPSVITGCDVYACGPGPMLKSLSSLAAKYKLQMHVALEQNMACGLGTCLGCVVETKSGYKRVCKEGPVFPVEEIIW